MTREEAWKSCTIKPKFRLSINKERRTKRQRVFYLFDLHCQIISVLMIICLGMLKKKEHEYRIMTEIEAIKKHRRLEEAKRLERMRAYEREKEYEAYLNEQKRLESIQIKRQKIINKKIEANIRAQAMKERIKDQIHSAKSMLYLNVRKRRSFQVKNPPLQQPIKFHQLFL